MLNNLKFNSANFWLVLTIFIVTAAVSCERVDFSVRRPVYVMAHMANSLPELTDFIERGANAVEVDIHFFSNGTVSSTYHGFPCDCLRRCDTFETIDNYLIHLNSASSFTRLALVYLDLKLTKISGSAKITAGYDLARVLIKYYFKRKNNVPKLIVSVPSTDDRKFLVSFIHEIVRRDREDIFDYIGWSVSEPIPVEEVIRMFVSLKNKYPDTFQLNVWLGDGITNCVSFLKQNSERLKEIIDQRNNLESIFKKVYHWTVDFTEHLKTAFRLGVDGIITNHPERVIKLLNQDEFRYKLRLATRKDDPFAKVVFARSTSDLPKAGIPKRIVQGVGNVWSSVNQYIDRRFKNVLSL